MIRKSLYELEGAHAKARQEYVLLERLHQSDWADNIATRPRLRVCAVNWTPAVLPATDLPRLRLRPILLSQEEEDQSTSALASILHPIPRP
jgi:hypothetical protein